MRNIIIVLSVIVCVQFAQAQLKYGAIAGLNAGAPIPSKIEKGAKGSLGVNPIFGFTLVRKSDDVLYYKASIIVDKRTASYVSPVSFKYIIVAGDSVDSFNGTATGKFNNLYLSLPFTAYYQLPKKLNHFSVGLGPNISYLLRGSNKGSVTGKAGFQGFFPIENQGFDESSNINRWEYGVNLGIMYSINERIDVQWLTSYGINSVTKPTDNFKDKTHNIYTNLSASYYF